MTPVERLRAAEVLLREAHSRTSELPEPSELDLAALRSADFGAIFVDPNIALALAEVLAWTATVRAAIDAVSRTPGSGSDAVIQAEDRVLALADALLGGGGA